MPAEPHIIDQQSYEQLRDHAMSLVGKVRPEFCRWVQSVRPKDGTPGRFRWSLETTRDANVASTAYILGSLDAFNATDDVVTDEDRAEGEKWIRAMHVGNEQYRDPALLDRKTPGWSENEPWPSPAMLGGVSGYARNALGRLIRAEAGSLPPETPPPGWPQPEDDPAVMLEWIRTRPWDDGPWGAGSHGMRMARFMLNWHLEGRLDLEHAVEALRFIYSIQDPDTGLWGASDHYRQGRINGAFKLFVFTRVALDLPLPHADRICAQVIDEMTKPDYDDHVGGCDEFDCLHVLRNAMPEARDLDDDRIKRLAAWRVGRIIEIFCKEDGGMSYSPEKCATSWIGFDMAPSIRQSDACAPGVLVGALKHAVELADMQDDVDWETLKPLGVVEKYAGVRDEIIDRLGLSTASA